MVVVRSAFPVALLMTAVVALACGGDPKPTGPTPPPAPNLLIGSYQCVQFLGYYKGSSGTGYYQGTCRAYTNATHPSRVDSIEVQPFDITTGFNVNRLDIEPGTFVYDSAQGRATVNYSTGRPSEVFSVWTEGTNTLTQTLPPFDFTGDGIVDSLRLTFRKI